MGAKATTSVRACLLYTSTKAETLLYCALIGYIHYEAPLEEQNFATLIEFLNAMEAVSYTHLDVYKRQAIVSCKN